MEAALINAEFGEVKITAPAALASGEILQVPSGQAGYYGALNAAASGDTVTIQISGTVEVAKTTSMVFVDGQRVYWDRSASKATCRLEPNTGDFYLGTADGDAASADTVMRVALNRIQANLIELGKGGWLSVADANAVGSATVDPAGSTVKLALSTSTNSGKIDMLSVQSVPVDFPFVVEGRVAVFDKGDNAALDMNIGIANGTHASDADSITEYLFLHFDGNSLNINAQSTDGTTTVASTDTTVDAVDDTYLNFVFDCRDLADIQVYINGVLMLTATTFALDAATGPLKALVHVEKSADDTPADLRVEEFSVRVTDVT